MSSARTKAIALALAYTAYVKVCKEYARPDDARVYYRLSRISAHLVFLNNVVAGLATARQEEAAEEEAWLNQMMMNNDEEAE